MHACLASCPLCSVLRLAVARVVWPPCVCAWLLPLLPIWLPTFACTTYTCRRRYPEGWSVWREDADIEGGYALAYSGARRPSGDDIDEYLTPPESAGAEGSGGGMLDGLGKFIKGFQAL